MNQARAVATRTFSANRLYFEMLPLADTTSLLRALATRLVDRVLGAGTPAHIDYLIPAKLAEPLAAAGIWWPKQNRGWLVRLEARLRASRRQRLAAPAFPKRTRGARRWRQRAFKRLAIRLGGLAPFGTPDAFWPLLGRWAWQDGTFRFDMARRVKRHLEKRVLFRPGDMPCAAFSPQALWLLIAMVRLPGTRWNTLFDPDMRARGRFFRRLQGIGRDLGLEPGWATSWDQWLLHEALWMGGAAGFDPDPTIAASIRALPLQAPRAVHADKPPARKPGRFHVLRRLRVLRKEREPDPAGVVEMARTDWARDCPVWLHAPDQIGGHD